MNGISIVGFVEYYFPRVYAFFQKVKQIFLCCAGNDDAREVDRVARGVLQESLPHQQVAVEGPASEAMSFDDFYAEAVKRFSVQSTAHLIPKESEELPSPAIRITQLISMHLGDMSKVRQDILAVEDDDYRVDLEDELQNYQEESAYSSDSDEEIYPESLGIPSDTERDSELSSSSDIDTVEHINEVPLSEEARVQMGLKSTLRNLLGAFTHPQVANAFLDKIIEINRDSVELELADGGVFVIKLPEKASKKISTEHPNIKMNPALRGDLNGVTFSVEKTLQIKVDGDVSFPQGGIKLSKGIGSGALLSIHPTDHSDYVALKVKAPWPINEILRVFPAQDFGYFFE